ncbi:hypothetical protein BASA81_003415 [Batrachochytrium salamandrivorans]|nr:hypothetical protein BASA81_003415 [Batrachochytrium salamandrivorans]
MKRVRFDASVGEEEEEEVAPSVRARGKRLYEEDEAVATIKRHQNEDDEEEAKFGNWREDESAGEQYRSEDIDRLEEAKMERFNMDEERELGNFDESGTFNWKRRDLVEDGEEEGGEDEFWLDQVVARPSSRAGETVAAAPKQHEVMQSMWQVVKSLASSEETALLALKRLQGQSKEFGLLTDACDQVLNCGLAEVYSIPRAELIKKMVPIAWEYRVVGGDDLEIFGPFPAADMQAWREDHGFFSRDSNEQCECRSVCPRTRQKSPWRAAAGVDTFLLL